MKVNFLTKVFVISTLLFITPIFSMERNSFIQFVGKLHKLDDSHKIDKLNELYTETYTSIQAQQILNTFKYGSHRLDAFDVLSTKLQDPQNKDFLLACFENDHPIFQKAAKEISERITVACMISP
ncbi:MAG: DUF4476 domain-containing protein [Leptospiraceae bacterium]|nr:DUF4476 domain-containing protein [Leptospiraceae bacterium]MCP5493406.1 DUF4476 domain-containing protein [Leptospiraceae bacterium]